MAPIAANAETRKHGAANAQAGAFRSDERRRDGFPLRLPGADQCLPRGLGCQMS
jgi:hypothetical protein